MMFLASALIYLGIIAFAAYVFHETRSLWAIAILLFFIIAPRFSMTTKE